MKMMECTDLVGLERPNHGMKHAPVMEEHKVLLVPIVRVHERRCDGGPLHLVQNLSHGSEVRDVRAIRIDRTVALRAGWEGVDEEFLDTTRVYLEVKAARHRVLPQLHEV